MGEVRSRGLTNRISSLIAAPLRNDHALYLAFSHNSEGLFRVTAAANPKTPKGTGFVVAIYKDEAAFCRLVLAAGLQPDETQRLTAAVELTEFNRSTPACCEDVDLDDGQLQILRLTNARTLFA